MNLKYPALAAGALLLASLPAIAGAAIHKHHKGHHAASIQSAQAAFGPATTPTRWQNAAVWAGERVDCDSPNVVTVAACPASANGAP